VNIGNYVCSLARGLYGPKVTTIFPLGGRAFLIFMKISIMTFSLPIWLFNGFASAETIESVIRFVSLSEVEPNSYPLPLFRWRSAIGTEAEEGLSNPSKSMRMKLMSVATVTSNFK